MPARGGDGDPRVNRVRCVCKALHLSIGPPITTEGAPRACRLEVEWGDSAALRDVPAARGCRPAAGPAIPASSRGTSDWGPRRDRIVTRTTQKWAFPRRSAAFRGAFRGKGMPSRSAGGDPRVKLGGVGWGGLHRLIGPSIAVEGAPGARRLEGEWGDSAARRGVPRGKGLSAGGGAGDPRVNRGAAEGGARQVVCAPGVFHWLPLADRDRALLVWLQAFGRPTHEGGLAAMAEARRPLLCGLGAPSQRAFAVSSCVWPGQPVLAR